MKHSILTIAASTLLFSGCFLNENKKDEQTSNPSGSVVPQSAELMYDLPSSIAPNQGATASRVVLSEVADSITKVQEDKLWDAYKPVPLYIALAQGAKQHVQLFLEALAEQNIPAELDVVDENNGNHIVSKTTERLVLGAKQTTFTISITPPEADKPSLKLWYWKNARNQYLGSLTFRGFEGKDAGNTVIVRFNNHNEDAFGRRMTVLFGGKAQKVNDPSLIRVRAVKKGNKVFVAGGSYHPQIEDEFWGGPEGEYSKGALYAFQAATRTDLDHAVMRVAFAPASANKSNLWKDYAINKVMLEAGTAHIKRELSKDTKNGDLAKALIAWSLSTQQPITKAHIAEGQTTAEFQEFQASYDVASFENVTSAEIKTYMTINKEQILNGDDQGFISFYYLTQVEQPVFFEKNAKVVLTRESSFGLAEADLSFVEEVDPSDVQEVDFDLESETEEK